MVAAIMGQLQYERNRQWPISNAVMVRWVHTHTASANEGENQGEESKRFLLGCPPFRNLVTDEEGRVIQDLVFFRDHLLGFSVLFYVFADKCLPVPRFLNKHLDRMSFLVKTWHDASQF